MVNFSLDGVFINFIRNNIQLWTMGHNQESYELVYLSGYLLLLFAAGMPINNMNVLKIYFISQAENQTVGALKTRETTTSTVANHTKP